MATNASASSGRSGLRAFLGAVGVAIGAFLLGNVLTAVVASALVFAGLPVLTDPSLMLGVSAVMLQGVGFGGAALLYLRYRGLGFSFLRVRVPTLRDLGWIVGGFVLLIALLAVVNVVFTTFGIQSAQNQVVELGNSDPTAFLVMIPLSFLLIGPGEELLFRGVVQGTLSKAMHPARAVILASAVFAVVHYSSLVGSGRFAYIGIVFLLALILGASYQLTDNLVVPAMIHGAYNAFQFAIQYLSATGAMGGM
jgi:uncharacterized protein